MDALERLDLDEVRAPTLIASEHLQRYELAAELCAGLRVADVCCGSGYGTQILRDGGARSVSGVDIDHQAIEAARAALASIDGIDLEAADALAYLERPDLDEAIDAVVMFEGLEHLPDPERAVAALRRLAKAGIRLAVSIPNSRALGETDNPFHHTEFGYEDATAALRSLGDDVTLLCQHAAEGTIIGAEGGGGATAPAPRTPTEQELPARLVLAERAEPEQAAHFIALVNFGPEAERAGARMLLTSSPVHRRYMHELEAANDRLWERIQALEARLRRIESSALWRATRPLRALRRRRS